MNLSDKVNPFISIITVVYNGENHLVEAIESVADQSYKNIEYVIVDGGSTDQTLDIINKYNDAIDTWVSEPDDGIYDAMNKGIKLSTGDIIGIVNSDDILNPGSIEMIASRFKQNPDLDYVYGTVERMKVSGEVYGKAKPLPKDKIEKKKHRQIPFPHPTLYLRKSVYDEIGTYNTTYSLNADYDFILRLLKSGYKGVEIEAPVLKFRDGGKSGGIQTFLERRRVWKNHGVPLLTRELNVFRSVSKVLLHSFLPNTIVKRIKKKYRKQSVQELH